MDRSNHYEAAFEAYLRARRLCYIAIDETRRTLLDENGTVKSLDFIVYGPRSRLLVDVKGRRFGGTVERPRRVWKNWSEEEDVIGLERWQERFGSDYRSLLVFAYHILPSVELPPDTVDLFEWRDRRYLLRAIPINEYKRHMKVISPRWKTVGIPAAVFRELVRPFEVFTHGSEEEREPT